MILIQIVPAGAFDAYKLLRAKVSSDARTWSWANRAKTRLRHSQLAGGYIKVGAAGRVAVAEVHVRDPKDAYFLSEKLVGRLVAWFPDKVQAINLQIASMSGDD